MRPLIKKTLLAAVCLSFAAPPERAGGKDYAGGLAAVATLSADARSIVSPNSSQVSLYKPENGAGLSLFFGRDLSNHLSVQASYLWNENDLTLVSTSFSPSGESMYQDVRSSSQKSLLGEVLVYFRGRGNLLRPYLSVGAGFVHLSSARQKLSFVTGSPILPPESFRSTEAAFPVAVGMDLALARGWSFRYSFSETMSANPISAELTPPGQRGLKNFRNLFGFVKHF